MRAAPHHLAVIVMLFLFRSSALAQNSASTPSTDDAAIAPFVADETGATAETERVIVTGSNIPTAEEVGPNPVQIINRDFIEKSGEHTTEQLLRRLPITGGSSTPVSNNAAGRTAGASSVSLRGFGEAATLVLIDGRRVAPYPVGGGSGTDAFVDLSSIPLAATESIEVLKDGASTTYGADAVAGVVNIKFRRDYRGTESTVQYGNTLDKDNGESSASLFFGAGDTRTNVTGVLTYYRRNSIFNRDRGYSNRPIRLSTFSSPGNFEVSRDAVIAAGVSPDQLPVADTFFASPPRFTNGNTPANDFIYTPGRSSRFNYNLFSNTFPDIERYGGLVTFRHKLYQEQLVIYGDVLYTNNKTNNDLAPAPTGNFQATGFTTIAIPPHAPGPILGGPSYAETGVPIGAFNPFNPFQQIISGLSRYRLAEFPLRSRTNETDAFLSTVGLKGDKLFDGSWGYDAGFRLSQIKNTSIDANVSASRFNRILNAADPIFDPSSPEFIGTTVPYNPFGDYRRPIPANSATIDFASILPKEIDTSKLATLDFTMYTTSLFKLPAGSVGFAFGAQFRHENLRQNLDDLFASADVLGVPTVVSTNAGRESYAVSAEIDIPIFSRTNTVPGFHALEFIAMGRFEEFLNNDTNSVVPKVGMLWQPFDDSLTVRATWGEGFREPSLFELAAAPNSFLDDVFDPITGQSALETVVLLNSNPNLDPEDAREFSGGIVYTPKFVSGLTISIDLWDIERTGVVGSVTQDVVNREAAGALLPGEKVLRNPDGTIGQIITLYQNGGVQTSRGIDFGLQYERRTSYGTFAWLTNATYTDVFLSAATPLSPQVNTRGSDEGNLKWKGNSRLGWTWKGFDLNTTVTYTDGFHEIFVTGGGKRQHWVQQTWFFDVQGSYDFTPAAPIENNPVAGYSKGEMAKKGEQGSGPDAGPYRLPRWKTLLNNTRITIGCNNVFGQDPPRSFANFTVTGIPYPESLYDSVGRFVYVGVKKKF